MTTRVCEMCGAPRWGSFCLFSGAEKCLKNLIHKETDEALRSLKAKGIEPVMTADEVLKLTRGDDDGVEKA